MNSPRLTLVLVVVLTQACQTQAARDAPASSASSPAGELPSSTQAELTAAWIHYLDVRARHDAVALAAISVPHRHGYLEDLDRFDPGWRSTPLHCTARVRPDEVECTLGPITPSVKIARFVRVEATWKFAGLDGGQ